MDAGCVGVYLMRTTAFQCYIHFSLDFSNVHSTKHTLFNPTLNSYLQGEITQLSCMSFLSLTKEALINILSLDSLV